MILYHASQTKGLTVLEPRVSNHGVPRVYFSEKRENVLVYLSNAIEKHCRETGFAWNGPWQKWGPYGFDPDGRLRLEEYYPDALAQTYKGIPGYIYSAETAQKEEIFAPLSDIPWSVTASEPVAVSGCEFIPDAYEEILKAETAGLIRILRYEEAVQNPKWMDWNRRTMEEEYKNAADHPEYRHFIRAKFGIGKEN
ncbi:MAG: hypothetical protein J5865_09085 [Lachnospiraceae bacterium]|nr:hypothetical protein [Lachnospiraceae bacterium]